MTTEKRTAKLRLGELQVLAKNRERRARSIARIVGQDDFVSAYEETDWVQALRVRGFVEASDSEGLKKWLRNWRKSQRTELEELTDAELRGMARSLFIPDAEHRDANKDTLVRLVRAEMERIENSRTSTQDS